MTNDLDELVSLFMAKLGMDGTLVQPAAAAAVEDVSLGPSDCGRVG